MRYLMLLALVVAPGPALAQEFDFHARGPYRVEVPRPESLLGYRIGERQTMYADQQRVLERMVAAAPARARFEVMGTTPEGRVMRLLVISDPANLARLDQVRADLARLAEPRHTSPADARAIAERTPAVALLTHSVHGNEPAGFEAAMETAYQLLASDEPATLATLKHVVVLIDPSQNPDGHERFAAWYNSVAVGTDEPAALEQSEPWSVWGRFNHYRFDMNRDLLAQSQPETQALAAAFVRWHPQVVADLHSTTSQYFFPPVAPATNQNLPPSTFQWFERFGRNNGAAFDAYGWQYYVRDVFDFFYPGYNDAWPSLRGATGMTFETDGGPELKKRKDDGTWVTFEMAIAHHYVASLATLATLAENSAERLRDFYEFHASALAEAGRRPLKRVVFLPGPDPARARWLAQRLAREEVEVTRTTQPFTASKATSYLGGGASRRSFPAGSYVVDLAQPQGRLAAAILEPRPAFDSAFVRKQLGRYDRNQVRGGNADREGYEFYDVTAWSLPLALGLEAYWTEDLPAVTGERVTPTEAAPRVSPPARARSAYLFSDQTESGVRLAMTLLGEGFRVAVATQPIRADAVTYPSGTFVVRLQRNPATVHQRVAALSPELGASVVPVQSAFPDSGPAGVGSESVVSIAAPRILLAAGDGVGPTAFGHTWFYFERELGIPVVPVRLAALATMDLGRYNVLIVPDGNPSRMWRELGEDGAARLKSWVESGGALIGYGSAASLLHRKELGLTTVAPVGEEADSIRAARDSAAKDTTLEATARPGPPIASPTAVRGSKPEFIPGAIFRATLDRTHWLTFGYTADQLPVFLETSTLFKPSQRGANPVAFVGDSLTLSGFVWPGNTEKFLRGSVWAAVENYGSGHVILFADDPLFRGYWRGPARLVTNAVLFGPGR